ncbi:RCC1 domain-containing protein [Myxococcota bacterium]
MRARFLPVCCVFLLFLSKAAQASVCVEGPSTSFVDIVAGSYHACGLTADGKAYCWGQDSDGQLGDGPAVLDDCFGVNCSDTPVLVDTSSMVGSKVFVQLVAGSWHTCGLASDGIAYCWGYDEYGQLGDMTGATPSDVPVPVDTTPTGGKPWVLLTAAWDNTCGLTSDGVAYCWGRDDYGQLGDGDVALDLCVGENCTYVPVAVDTTPITGEKTFASLVCGTLHACGVTADGTAYCWGRDNMGQLGDGNVVLDDCGGVNCSQLPVAVDTTPLTGSKVFIHLGLGNANTCGVTSDGKAYCWGVDTNGELGNGSNPVDDCGGSQCSLQPEPLDVSPVTGEKAFLQLVCGLRLCCGLTAQGVPYCWGWDINGQLGNGSVLGDSDAPSPVETVPVTGEKAIIRVTVGEAFGCKLTGEGVAYCWGQNMLGQLGDSGTFSNSESPVSVDQVPINSQKTYKSIAAGIQTTCGVDQEGKAYCWGTDIDEQLGDGSLPHPECGFECSLSAVELDTAPVADEKAFVQVAGGAYHGCGLTAQKVAYCWGTDEYGQLGDGGSPTNSPSPVAVNTTPIAGEKAFVQLVTGSNHTCGLTSEGVAYCWGRDDQGQLGDGFGDDTSQSPLPVNTTPITGETTFVQLIAGYRHTCGLTADGVVYCWGGGTLGELGDGSGTGSWDPVPVTTVPIVGEKAFIRLAGGFAHTCGLTSQRVVYCWGSDTSEQLGNGPAPIDDCGGSPCAMSPVAVDTTTIAGEKTFRQLGSGPGAHACGVTTEGVAYCWGRDNYGELGNGGASVDAESPAAVDTSSFTGETTFVQTTCGGTHTCGLTADGVSYCWGADNHGQLGDGGEHIIENQSPLETGDCNDGVFCNGDDSCDGAGNCIPSGVDPCQGGPECNNTCNESADNCYWAEGTLCTDPAPDDCQVAACTAFGSCNPGYSNEPNGTSCDDGTFCNGTDQCDGSGGCTVNAGNPCTGGQCNLTCNEGLQNCFDPATTPCDDGTYCNGSDTCDGAGTCVPSGVSPCDGGPQCDNFCNEGPQNCFVAAGTACGSGTDTACDNPDECDGAGACLPMYEASGFNCDDGTYCNGADTCDGSGACTSDGDPCLPGSECNRTCNEVPQNCFDALGTACGSPSSDQCDNADQCDGGGTCLPNHVTDGTACVNPDPCSDLDTCQSGACAAGTPNKDTDGDTYVDLACGGNDCDDDATAVNPGVVEQSYGQPMCTDTIDNDCDGDTDVDDTGCMECTSDPQCDDGNECTTDACVASACENTPVIDGTSCDDGQYCSDPDACQGGICQGPQRDCSGVADQCNNAQCNEGLDQCEAIQKFDGTGCEDGLYCTINDSCQAGFCQPGGPLDCSSLNDQCHTGACDDVGDTCFADPAPNEGNGCDDGLFCTTGETCQSGNCTGGGPTDCSGVEDQCNASTCNEGTDACDPDSAPFEGNACDDMLYCTVGETCQSGSCTGGSGRDCSGAGDQCNAGVCNEGTDACEPDPAPREGQPCDDGLYCSDPDTCQSGNCQGPALDCSSMDNACNVGACNEGTDACELDPGPKEGLTCDDGDACTGPTDTCVSGTCFGPPLDADGDLFVSDACGGQDCDDGNTNVNPGVFEGPGGDPKCGDNIDNDCDNLTDLADPTCGTCFVDLDCDDNDVCNGSETCSAGSCNSGTSLDCNDNEVCTTDSCDPVSGCQYANNSNPCDDGNPCTTPDVCSSGTCSGQTGNRCTSDPCLAACVPQGASYICDVTPDFPPAACNDADPCTENDTCSGGNCVGTAKDCSGAATDDCHEGYCASGTGVCQERPLDGTPCDDGVNCTTDQCEGGVCVGRTIDCSGLNDGCNVGRCDEPTGNCIARPRTDGTPCNDSLYCTVGDACAAGVCSGPARDCSWAGDQCNLSACDDGVDQCVSTPLDGVPCNDGLYCSDPDNCTQGSCTGPDRDCSPEIGSCYEPLCTEADRCKQGLPKDPPEDCDDGDVCTDTGRCNGRGDCIIEGYCDEILPDPSCTGPAVAYRPDDLAAPDCRFRDDKVGIDVELKPTAGGAGSFVPVRVVLSNAGVRGWNKPLRELRVILTMTSKGGKIAYITGSALLQGGDKYLEEDIDEDNNRAVLKLFQPGAVEDTQMMPAPGGGDWVLDFVVMRGEDAEGIFQLDVWAPCDCPDYEIGCHFENTDAEDIPILDLVMGTVRLQRISTSKYVSTSGKVTEDPDDPEIIGELLKSPVLGCQCGTQAAGGGAWLVFLGLIWVVTSRRLFDSPSAGRTRG